MSDEGTTQTPSPGSSQEVPEWASKEIRDLRDESASRRVENKRLNETLTETTERVQVLTDEKASAEKARDDAQFELLKLSVALDAGVPGDRVRTIAGRLNGTTEEELKADAQKLVEEFGLNQPGRATDPSQGRGGAPGANSPQPVTPQAQFAQLMANLGYGNNR